ncbi:WXG100 family type VII secretion target [Cellulomonas sp. NPDC089187]|uniref:WXG100 family type VII secretion target n=1 Tax=Cellulomonas sp. NPDC089187 TaxID=3154970 RepID=UPI00342C5A83
MANLNVTFDELTDVAGKLRSGKEACIGELEGLKSAVDGLIGAGFQTDNASGTFQSTYADFNKAVTDTVNALEDLENFLRRAAEAYRSTDEELANALKGA